MSTDTPYIGIDFGTTNSSMAWLNPKTGQAEVLLNAEGEQKTPSLVYFGSRGNLVGTPVEHLLDELRHYDQDERRAELQRIVRSIKRNLLSPPVITLPGGLSVRPAEVAAELFRKLKRDAEEGHFHRVIKRAVITCPAVFDTTQRNVIKEAARLAGFEEVELLEEPVAAALAFARANQQIGSSVLVYDLGGGTFDLAVIVKEADSAFRVGMETDGDARCGGDDFDLALYDFWDRKALEQAGASVNYPDGGLNLHFLKDCRLRKENLSLREQGTFGSLLPGGRLFKTTIDRTTFEGLIRPRIADTVHRTKSLLGRARARGIAVGTVVLIGGSTRIPLIQEMLKGELGMAPSTWMNKDVAVTLGAAYHAHDKWLPQPPPPKPAAPPPAPAPPVSSPSLRHIENKVKQIIIDELGVDENEVTPNARFIDDLGADSLDTVELVMRFEEEFGIEIPDEDAEKIQSVRDAYNYIRRYE